MAIKVMTLSFIRAKQSYGPDDPFRYECRVNEDPVEPMFSRGSKVRGHGKTPSEALDAALMPHLEREHERGLARTKKDEEIRKAVNLKLARQADGSYLATVYQYTFEVKRGRHNGKRCWHIFVDGYDFDTALNLHEVRIAIARFAKEKVDDNG